MEGFNLERDSLGPFLRRSSLEWAPHMWAFSAQCLSKEAPRHLAPQENITQRALWDILMPRGKNWLPTVSRQFLTLNYPRPNCLFRCFPNCLSPTREDIFSSFKIALVARVVARQLSGKNCLAAIFASRHQDASPGPLGIQSNGGVLFRPQRT